MALKRTLTPKQSQTWHELLEDPRYRRILIDGGARSTKTFLLCAWLIHQAETYAGARILIARKTLTAARKSVWGETLMDIVRGHRHIAVSESALELRFSKGSLIRVDGLDDQERVDKILGTEYAHIFFNESTQITWQTVNIVLSRLAQPVPGLPARKALFDCNPKSPRHWLYRAAIQKINPDTGTPLKDAKIWARRHFSPLDNPHLPDDAKATLDGLSGVQRRRLWLGEWCEQAGAVYDEFSEDIHTFTELPNGAENWVHIRGIDFGYTNPFVCIWGAVDGDGRLWIYREHYQRGRLVADHAAAIKAATGSQRIAWTVADHDAEDRATLAAAGIPTRAARKAVLQGINAVKARLRIAGDGRPRLMIWERCTETISELYDYAWPQSREGKHESETPVKDRDHALDALRYMATELDAPRPDARAIVFAADGRITL